MHSYLQLFRQFYQDLLIKRELFFGRQIEDTSAGHFCKGTWKSIDRFFQHFLPTKRFTLSHQISNSLPVVSNSHKFSLAKIMLSNQIIDLIFKILESKFVVSNNERTHDRVENYMTAVFGCVYPVTVEHFRLVLRDIFR